MRIGFDVSSLCSSRTGVGTYAFNLLEQLNHENGDQILPLAHCRLVSGKLDAYDRQTPRLNKTLWMQALLPWEMVRLRLDVCHFTNSVGPSWTPCPSIVTIHDATPWLIPECYDRGRLLTMRAIVPIAARRAAAIIAGSYSAKRDITRALGVPETKVHVIYPAPAPTFRPLPAGPALDAVRRRERLPDRFVLHVGTLEPRKNLVRLVEAFGQLRRHGFGSHGLVLAGMRGWRDAAVFAAIERLGLGDAVRVLGYVPEKTLVSLYNLADALAFPSLYEGFGFPLLEAMACGTPVVTSPNGALREIAGDAARFVEPTEVESIAVGLREVLADPAKREELGSKGLAHVTRFSWSSTAEETRRLYVRVAGGRDHAAAGYA